VVKFVKLVFVNGCKVAAECSSLGFTLTKLRKCSEIWLEHLQILMKPVFAMLYFISVCGIFRLTLHNLFLISHKSVKSVSR